MTILGLIIDDGVSDRGHRKTIFNPTYRWIGCNSQPQTDKLVTVFNLTEKHLAARIRVSTLSNSENDLMIYTSPQYKGEN